MTSPAVPVFRNNWFNESIKQGWKPLIASLRPRLLLEIGSYEGASACFLINELYRNKIHQPKLFCVDTWEGGIEHQENNVDMDSVRLSFDSNLSLARQSSFNYVDIEVLSRRSDEALPWLIHSGYKEKFDFIYVDGSHQAPDVLVDAVLSALLLRKGGVLVLMTIFGEIGCQDMMGCALPPSR